MKSSRNGKPTELEADVVIVGGGVGGVAATLAAARSGKRVLLTEETDWIGGQLTQQAVPPDEHPWIERFGGTRTYFEFRRRVREFYRRNYPLTGEAYACFDLNPGDGSVSRLCHEPRVALAVLYELLMPYLSCGLVRVLLNVKPVAADVEGDGVRAVQVRRWGSNDVWTLCAPFFLDATELGDLLPLTGTEFVTGFESQRETQEPHAPSEPQPENQQAFTYCFAVDYCEGKDHTIEKPELYDFWRNYVPSLDPPWPGRLLDFVGCHPVTLERRVYVFDPIGEAAGTTSPGLWLYRRILNRRNLRIPASDICLVNWPMNDYWLGNLVGVSEEEAARHRYQAKQLSLSLLYWLQTEAPRPDGGVGWKGLRLRPDVVDTEDGLAKHPYIRESRRIRAEFTVLEQHVGTEARIALTGASRETVRAEVFPDSVGIGSYRIDLHPSTGGNNYIDISSLPFQIPLGALLPIRMENLLPACKNLGVTHLTNGCYRLHPVEWNVGESAGALAAFCLDRQLTPRAVRHTPSHLRDFQNRLRAQGVELEWPRLSPR